MNTAPRHWSPSVAPILEAGTRGIGGPTVKAPSNTSATAASSTRIDVSWQDNSSNEARRSTFSPTVMAVVGALTFGDRTARRCRDAWGLPHNLGPVINTTAAEQHPFVMARGGEEMLFFSRNVATPPALNLDVFVSTRTR